MEVENNLIKRINELIDEGIIPPPGRKMNIFTYMDMIKSEMANNPEIEKIFHMIIAVHGSHLTFGPRKCQS